MKKSVVFIFFVLWVLNGFACTVAVISGKYTSDGRPLLWKNRDTWAIHNKIMYFNDGKYEYVGLVNSGDKKGKSVWIGFNSQGFAIMNSASYNLNLGDSVKLSGAEGKLIKFALANCATVEDFEKLLDTMKKPTRLEANFGVIDAQGGAALFEVSNWKYVKFDANDPKVAPFGYIIRANYSFTGKMGTESSGYIRYNTVNEMFYNAASTASLTDYFIINDVTRELYNSLTKQDYRKLYGNIPQNTPTFVFFHDFVPRRLSASSIVIKGVKKGENPELTTMWATVGFPLTSISVPVWIKKPEKIPYVLQYNEKFKDSPVCYAALTLKKQVFPILWGKYASKYYININSLINADNTGIIQKIHPYELKIYLETQKIMSAWYENNRINTSDLTKFYEFVNKTVIKMYEKEFAIDLK